MELITNRYNKSICKCEKCNSEFYVNDDDVITDYRRMKKYWQCPLCKHENYIDGLEQGNKDNFPVFPIEYHETSHVKGAAEISDEEINRWIKECIDNIRKNNSEYEYVCSGDTDIAVFKLKHLGNEELYVLVSKHSYSAYIPFEAINYD